MPSGRRSGQHGEGQAHISAEQSQAEKDAWLPGAYAHQGGPARPEASPPEGAQAGRTLGTGEDRLPDLKLASRERIRRAADFRKVFRKGLRLDGSLFVLLAAENGLPLARLGLAVGRKVGNAVERNRAKRLLRDSFRRNKVDEMVGLDLVFVPKREIVGRSQADVEREFCARLKRLAQRRKHGPSPRRTH